MPETREETVEHAEVRIRLSGPGDKLELILQAIGALLQAVPDTVTFDLTTNAPNDVLDQVEKHAPDSWKPVTKQSRS
jgi:hypothetical protein